MQMNNKKISKRKVISLSILLAAVVSSTGVGNNSNYNVIYPLMDVAIASPDVSSNIEKAVKFRGMFGMDTSEKHIKDVLNRKKIENLEMLFDTPVTPEEKKMYERRLDQSQDAIKLKKQLEASWSQKFGGLYFDSTKGTIHIKSVKHSKDDEIKIIMNSKYPNDVIFEEAQFTEIELKDTLSKIEKLMELDGNINQASIDVKNNRIKIGIIKDSSEIRNTISMKLTNRDIVTFDEVVQAQLYSDTTRYPSPWPSGAAIGTSTTNLCTSGFFGTTSNGNKVTITAGHCDTNGSTKLWYQPAGTDRIGTWWWRTRNIQGGPALEGDVGVINMTATTGGARVPYPNGNGSDYTPLNGSYISDMVGDVVYFRGFKTGSLQSGRILSTNKIVNFNGGNTGNLLFT